MKKAPFVIVYAVLTALFTVYVVLTTFVIKDAPDVMVKNRISAGLTPTPGAETAAVPEKVPGGTQGESASAETDVSTSEAGDADVTPGATVSTTPAPTFSPTPTIVPTWSENGYLDSDMSVSITKYREFDSDIFVVDVVLDSTDLLKAQLATAVGRKSNWEVVSDISKTCENLIVSVNGDCWASRNGYSIKNGVLIRDSVTRYSKGLTFREPGQEDMVIFKDGSVRIIKEGEVSAEELMEMGAWQLFNFGPALINDYADVSKTSVTTTDVADSKNPRTAIGSIDDLHYVFVVVDGRSTSNKGVTCSQLAEFGMKLGLRYFYNLDGGGSSTLYFNGEVINQPCRHKNKVEEQTVSDIIYVGH
jgi:exopolysaccharide biosynthesis protein